MENSQKYIKNPLSIIALFASLSEAIATAVLPFISDDLQKIFIWFVMGFPVLLVSLFFFTLNKKHHVLYAPSDYKSDESFTGLAIDIRSQNKGEIISKNREEIKEIESHNGAEAKQKSIYDGLINNPKVDYFLAEELALKKLNELYENKILKNQVLKLDGNQYPIDGIVKTNFELSLFEVKYFPRLKTPLNGIGKTYTYFEDIYKRINKDSYQIITFNFIIVTGIDKNEQTELLKRINDFINPKDLRINILFYDFTELKKEYGLEN